MLLGRRSAGAAFASLLVAACAVACLTGCPGEQTINHLSQTLTINPIQSGGQFIGYTRTTFSPGIPAGKHVHLLSATVTSSSGEFSWVSSMVATAEMSDAPILLEKTSFTGATSPADLDVVYTGDLVPFSSDNSITIYWTLDYAASQARSYPNGVELTFDYEAEIK